jgi:clan AA aspartic protease
VRGPYWKGSGQAPRYAEEILMGVAQVTVTIRNPAALERAWEGLFLVDTGAIDCLVPRPHLEAIGLKPKGQRMYELADGSEIKMDITTGDIEFMGEVVGGTIIFGEADAEPILGMTALESVGIEVDPQNQRLKRMPAVRLKSMRRKPSLIIQSLVGWAKAQRCPTKSQRWASYTQPNLQDWRKVRAHSARYTNWGKEPYVVATGAVSRSSRARMPNSRAVTSAALSSSLAFSPSPD